MSKEKSTYLKQLSNCLYGLSALVGGFCPWDRYYLEKITDDDSLKRFDVFREHYDCIIDFFKGDHISCLHNYGYEKYSPYVGLEILLYNGNKFSPCHIIDEARVYFKAIEKIHDNNAYYIKRNKALFERLDSNKISEDGRYILEDMLFDFTGGVIDNVVLFFRGLHVPMLLLAAKAELEVQAMIDRGEVVLQSIKGRAIDELLQEIFKEDPETEWTDRKLVDEFRARGYKTTRQTISARPLYKTYRKKIPKRIKEMRLGLMQIDTEGKTHFSRDKKAANYYDEQE